MNTHGSHSILLATIALITLTTAACARDQETDDGSTPVDGIEDHVHEPSSPEHLHLISLLPGDLTTSTGRTPLQAFVAPAPVPQDKLQAIADSLRLLRASDQQPIPFTVEFFNPQDRAGEIEGGEVIFEPAGEPAWVRVTPDQPLDDSAWYILSLSEVPDETFGVPTPFFRPVGAYSVRFMPGSQPTLRHALLCPAAEGYFAADFSFSENVVIPNAELPQKLEVYFGESPYAEKCVLNANRTYPSATNPMTVLFECQGNVGDYVTVVVRTGMVSASSGKPLATYDGEVEFERTIRLSDLPRTSGSNACRHWSIE